MRNMMIENSSTILQEKEWTILLHTVYEYISVILVLVIQYYNINILNWLFIFKLFTVFILILVLAI